MAEIKPESKFLNKFFGWQVAKEVRHTAPNVAMEQFSNNNGEYSGIVFTGGKKNTCSFRFISPTILEGECSCPVYRREASLCAHIGLLYWHACGHDLGRHTEPVLSHKTSRAYKLTLPEDLSSCWEKKQIQVRMEVTDCRTPGAADGRITGWLVRQGIPSGNVPPVFVLPQGAVRNDFFQTIAGHPDVYCGKTKIGIEDTPPLFSLKLKFDGNGLYTLNPGLPALGVKLDSWYWSMKDKILFPWPQISAPKNWDDKSWKLLLEGKPQSVSEDLIIHSLESLQSVFEIEEVEACNFLKINLSEPVFRFYWQGNQSFLRVAAFADYGEGKGEFPILPMKMIREEIHKDRNKPHTFWKRNLISEERYISRLETHGFVFSPSGWVLNSSDAVENFWAMELPVWRQDSKASHDIPLSLKKELDGIDRLQPALIVKNQKEDWLEAQFVFTDSAGIHYPSAEVLKLVRSGRKKMKSPHGKVLRVDASEVNDWSTLFSESDVIQTTPGTYRISHRDVPVFAPITSGLKKSFSEALSDKEWERLMAILHGHCQAILRPYQIEGIKWLVRTLLRAKGALLGDDMGLGKTLQTLAAFVLLREIIPDLRNKPSLIVVPATLLANWKDETEKFFPELSLDTIYGKGREQTVIRELGLTTYGLLTRDFARHRNAGYGLIAFDEASLVRNPDTDAADALRRIPSDFRIALTGTPVENSVKDLWSIFEIVIPGYLGTRTAFHRQYEEPVASLPPDSSALRRLRYKTAPLLLRRTKAEVAPELPPKHISTRWCELSPAHKTLYHALLSQGTEQIREAEKKKGKEAARMIMLTTLLRLRQLCDDIRLLPMKHDQIPHASGKMESLMSLIPEIIDNHHKVLIFSQFSSMLKLMETEISQKNIPTLLLDGSVRNRTEIVDRFRMSDGPPVFLISLKAGGYGLNLQEADTVIHVDPWWNPAVENQATDRAYRLGQSRPVTVYKMICRGTVEEKILNLQQRKISYLSAAFGASEDSSGSWSENDMREILGI